MSLEVISFYAKRSPDAVAVIDADGSQFSYAETAVLITAIAEQLATELAGLDPIGVVAVAVSNQRLQLLLCFALEALGIATLPFVQPIEAGFESALNRCTLVLAQQLVLGIQTRQVSLDAAWFAIVAAHRPGRSPTPIRPKSDAVAMVLTTSGTTGKPKLIPLDWRAFRARELNRLWQYGFNAESRFLVTMPVSVSSIYFSIRAVLQFGGGAVFWNIKDPVAGFGMATHTAMLPIHVRNLLALVPGQIRTLPLHLFTIGAPLAKPLREAAALRLVARIQNSYGINELGGCMWVDEDGMGDPLPGVDVEVVRADGSHCAAGEAGVLRLRSPGMARGYLDPADDIGRFIDGWFYPGDTALMTDSNRVRPLGRTDGLINLGGNKVSPELIEDLLHGLKLAQDLAVCAIVDAQGVEELYIAVAGQLVDDAGLVQAVRDSFSEQFGIVRIAKLTGIPRGEVGKVQRSLLRKMLTKAPSGT